MRVGARADEEEDDEEEGLEVEERCLWELVGMVSGLLCLENGWDGMVERVWRGGYVPCWVRLGGVHRGFIVSGRYCRVVMGKLGTWGQRAEEIGS